MSEDVRQILCRNLNFFSDIAAKNNCSNRKITEEVSEVRVCRSGWKNIFYSRRF